MKLWTIFNSQETLEELEQEKQASVPEKKGKRRKKRYSLRKFRCQQGCTRLFSCFSAKNYHENTVHRQLRFGCPWILCQKTYTSIYELDKHVNKGHDLVHFLTNSP